MYRRPNVPHPEHNLLELLKARVVQFPAVEQKLVQVRNRLDHEVRRFHDIDLYTERLFKQADPQSILKITVEGLVDIFDLEVSGILKLADDGETLLPLANVGPDRPAETLRLDPIWKKLQIKPAARQTPIATIGPFLTDAPGLPQELADVIACPSHGADGIIHMIFWAGITHENASVYDRLGGGRVCSFAIYCHQAINMLNTIQYERELLRAKETAESASHEKVQFLANMSHELRTPVKAIIGFTHLAMGDEPNPSVRESLDKIDDSSRTILRLLDMVLDLTKTDEGSTSSFTGTLDRPSNADLQTDDPVVMVPSVTDTPFSLKGTRVLVVENNLINQIIIESLLVRSGIDVTLANDGQEALDALHENNRFHAVLMDCQMPYMDGYQAAQLIRNNPRFDTLPIIALTAHALEGDREKSLEAGMDDHLTKPIEPDLVLERLRRSERAGRVQLR